MTEARDERIIAEALAVVESTLQNMGDRQMFSSSEVVDVLLDLRAVLVGANEPAQL